MTQAPPAETLTLRIVACETCDQLFLVSPRRETCPGCGGGPGVEFFTFEASPEGVQLVGFLTDAPPELAEIEPPPAPAPEPGPEPAGASVWLTRDEGIQGLVGLGYTVEEAQGRLPFNASCPSCGADLLVSVTDSTVAVRVRSRPGPEPDDVPEAPTLTESDPQPS